MSDAAQAAEYSGYADHSAAFLREDSKDSSFEFILNQALKLTERLFKSFLARPAAAGSLLPAGVESRSGAVAQSPVSRSRSSNRTGGCPAFGFRTRFFMLSPTAWSY